MKKYTIYYTSCAEYIANSEEEAREMFNNDPVGGWIMEVDEIIEEEIENDEI